MLTIGSLFSGIGGLELGLECAGLGPVLWQVEIDPFCREVLEAHWPKARRFEDVQKVGKKQLENVDVICGGFPCQGASLAGKGLGLADPRTGLWREYARIVREIRPRFVVVENVPGLLRRGLDVVVSDLANAGYEVEATRLAAADVGAPHKRERIFLVAYCKRVQLRHEQRRSTGEGRSGASKSRDASAELANGYRIGREAWSCWLLDRERASRRHELNGCCGSQWPPGPEDLRAWRAVPADSQPSVCRLADGIPARLARRSAKLKALGNAVVPACAEIVGRRVLEILQKERVK